VVEIVGHQWWWEVRYSEEGVTTANELHIPVGRPVAIELTSADVIHSFWVPELAGKLDALPDGTNTLVIEAEEPGEYRSECAEFCGLQHAQMGLVVVAEPTEQFSSWVAGQQQPAQEPADETARRGRDVFAEAGCGSCHTVQGTEAEGADGPDLTHVARRPTIGAGAAPNAPDDLAAWVADPHTVKEGVAMPAADLTDEELEAVVAYLETLQ
jgi:cytochrome c oxidase subunit 2